MKQRIVRALAGSLLAAAVHGAWAADTPDSAVIRFDISRYEVAGNSLLSPAAVDAALAPFAGKGRDFGDVQRALEALEALYQAHGYSVVTVQLPEQELNGGVVRLNVVQTRIGQITVRGNKNASEANVRHALPTLVVGQTPNLHRVSANLKMANENPARKIRMQLQSAAVDGEVDALLEVTDD